MHFCPTTKSVDSAIAVADLRAATLRRRFKISASVERLIGELAFGVPDNLPTSIRVAPLLLEGRR